MALSARNKALLPGFIFLLICGVFVMRFGMMILVMMLIPSVLAFFIDRKVGKPSFKVIAACNISAALPYIVPIIQFSLKKHFSEVSQVVDDPMVWAFIYCAALAGWAMLYLAKIVARVVTLMHYDYSIKLLERKQEILVKEWGDDIKNSSA